MDNSLCWHAEQVFVFCLKLRERNQLGKGWALAWAMQDVGSHSYTWAGCSRPGRCPCLPDFWEGAAIVHSPDNCWHFDIISIFQRKRIPPENFQWALIMCPDWNVSTAKLHFSNFLLSRHLNSPSSVWDFFFLSWTRLWQSLYNSALLPPQRLLLSGRLLLIYS